MKNSVNHQISMQSRPDGKVLFFVWILLVILPGLIFFFILEKLLEYGEDHQKNVACVEMISEAEDFRREVTTAAFLEKTLRPALRKISETDRLEADQIQKELDKNLGFKVFAVFSGNKKGISYALDKKYEKDFLVSRTMLKNFLTGLDIEFKNSQLIKSEKIRTDHEEKIISRGQAFFKSLFRLLGEIKLEPEKIQTALSGKPYLKRVFILYLPVFHGDKIEKQIIVLIRELDIPLTSILNGATEKFSESHLTRHFKTVDLGKEQDFIDFQNPISQFSVKADYFSFTIPFPSELINRIACKGTFYPFLLKQTQNRFPVLEIRADRKYYQHPLRQFLKPLKMSGLILILFISLLFMRFYFFGLELPLRIKTKIMTAVIVASILPVLALFLIARFHENFRNNSRQYEINNLLNQQVEEFNIAINAYRTGLETQHARLSESLNFMKEFEFVPFLKYWMKNRPITAIMTRINHNNGLIGRNSKIRIMPFESELKDFLFTCVENSFRRRKEDGRESDGSVGMFRFRIKGLGILISDLGMIHNSSFSNLSDLYSLIPVFPGNDRHAEVTSSFLIKYSSILMLQDFFRQQPDLLNVTEKAGFKIQKCYIPLSSHSELPERGDLISSPGFPYEQIIDKLEKIQNSRSQETWVNNRNGRIQVVHVEFSQNLNVLVALIAEQTGVDQHSILPPLTNMFLYLIGLLLINLVLMGRFFVAPLRLLQQSAEEVAEGHFSHQVSMESGDEFSELGHAFNQMIAGLDEKERMSSFVSENVLAETADENENVLLPGGERSQVSVLFCSLPELKKFLASSSPDIAISYLDRLIDRCDIISRQYNGVIDKIIEDTVMIVFRQQDAGNSHVIAACKTALEISSFFPNDECPLRLSAGISSGEAVSGKIGSLEGKLDYTVIGNPVNLAARLKAQAAAADQTGILLCPQTIRMLKGIGRLRFIERVEIKGRTRSFPMYELQGLRL